MWTGKLPGYPSPRRAAGRIGGTLSGDERAGRNVLGDLEYVGTPEKASWVLKSRDARDPTVGFSRHYCGFRGASHGADAASELLAGVFGLESRPYSFTQRSNEPTVCVR